MLMLLHHCSCHRPLNHGISRSPSRYLGTFTDTAAACGDAQETQKGANRILTPDRLLNYRTGAHSSGTRSTVVGTLPRGLGQEYDPLGLSS